MHFNSHSELVGKHAPLSASKYHWINYTDEKFDLNYRADLQKQRGTDLHALASECVRLGVKLRESTKTLNMYVNDALGFRMSPEVCLAYSYNAFGTADAISFRDMVLRIHDLKTGMTKTSFKQLLVYAALFCLEYDKKPTDIKIVLRIYQNDQIFEMSSEGDTPEELNMIMEIINIMDKIVRFDDRIIELRREDLR